MKLSKFWKGLIVIVPVVGTISIASCGPKGNTPEPEPEPVTETAKEYIQNRTFGIASNYSAGTCWVIADATKTKFDDYSYYIATNWHVKLGVDGYQTGYRCEGMDLNTYMEFKSISWLDDLNFTFDGSDKKNAIDFHIAKVNFGTATTIPTLVKEKLDVLNKVQKNKGYINKFYLTNDTQNLCSNKLYCGGYPARNIDGTTAAQKWEFETLDPNTTLYIKKSEMSHPVDNSDPAAATIIDTSPQYYGINGHKSKWDEVLQDYIPEDWTLTGGASGSMLISSHDNEWVVVGIYWGGAQETSGDHTFWPYWSIFKSGSKNFVESYE